MITKYKNLLTGSIKDILSNFSKDPLYIFKYSFIRYLLIGLSSVVIDFGLFNLLKDFLSVQALYSNLISSFVTIFFNFTLSNYWTFKSGNKKKIRKLVKFVSVTAFNYIVSNVLMYLFIEYSDINLNVAKLFITGLVVSWNFIIYRVWVFKE